MYEIVNERKLRISFGSFLRPLVSIPTADPSHAGELLVRAYGENLADSIDVAIASDQPGATSKVQRRRSPPCNRDKPPSAPQRARRADPSVQTRMSPGSAPVNVPPSGMRGRRSTERSRAAARCCLPNHDTGLYQPIELPERRFALRVVPGVRRLAGYSTVQRAEKNGQCHSRRDTTSERIHPRLRRTARQGHWSPRELELPTVPANGLRPGHGRETAHHRSLQKGRVNRQQFPLPRAHSPGLRSRLGPRTPLEFSIELRWRSRSRQQ